MMNDNLQFIKDDKLENIKKLSSKILLFTATDIIYVEPAAIKKTKDEITDLIGLFESNNRAISSGITVGDTHYEVHRYFEDMLVGRKAEEEGEGVAFIKVPLKTGQPIFMIATYKLPTLSSRIVPMMKEYCIQYSV